MFRTVEIRNLSGSEVNFPGHSIAPMGRLILPLAEYIQTASDNDLTAYPISVRFPDVELRSVSVREFGAKGDGVSDDTYFIQSAIDSVASYGGGVVSVPVGVYLISSITLYGNVSLIGDSMEASVLKQISDKSAAVSISSSSCSIQELVIRCFR